MMIPNVAQILQLTQAGGLNSGFGQGVNGLFGGQSGLFGEILAGMQPFGLGVNASDAAVDIPSLAKQSLDNLEEFLGEEGDIAAGYVQVTQIITVVYQEFTTLQTSGIDLASLDGAAALAKAYETLGMDPAEAQSRAARISIMLLLMDERNSAADLVGQLDQLGLTQSQTTRLVQVEQQISVFRSVSYSATSLTLADQIRSGNTLTAALNQQQIALAAQGGDATGAGRVGDIFGAIADRAAQLFEGGDIAANLKEITSLARRLVADAASGGLDKLADNQVAPRAVQAQQALQNALESQPPAGEPGISPARPEKSSESASEVPTLRGQSTPVQDIDSGFVSANKPSPNVVVPLAEPLEPVYIIRAASDGSTEVIDMKTGQVVDQAAASAPPVRDSAGAVQQPQEAILQSRLAHQVRVHVGTLARHGGGQIIVGLNPAELGRIQVRLKIVDGTVKGAITVQRPDVAEQLAKDIRSLEQSLQDAGLEIAETGIAVQLENQSSTEDSNRDGSNLASGQGHGRQAPIAQDEEDILRSGRWYDPERILDIEV